MRRVAKSVHMHAFNWAQASFEIPCDAYGTYRKRQSQCTDAVSAKRVVYARLVGEPHAHAERDAPAHQHCQVLCASSQPRAQQECRSGDLHARKMTRCIVGALFPQYEHRSEVPPAIHTGGQPGISLFAQQLA